MLYYFPSVRRTRHFHFNWPDSGWRPLMRHKVQSLFLIYLGTVLPCLEGRGNGNEALNATGFIKSPPSLIRAPRWGTHYWAESPSRCARGLNPASWREKILIRRWYWSLFVSSTGQQPSWDHILRIAVVKLNIFTHIMQNIEAHVLPVDIEIWFLRNGHLKWHFWPQKSGTPNV